ncbi:MAG: phenylalanine--tRNA ligase subunit beta, partial [Clostridia bacterium]|nr:phenylalanine--tRNA ligase subunit beta [Clostridia bacterium]
IRKGKLRGLESCGMFCSGEELGITDDWYEGASVHGILIFREDLPLGESVKDILAIDDVIFDVNVTANRPDCQSVLGMAREVAAVLGKPLKMPDLSYNTDAGVSTLKTVKITDDAFDLCPRYKGRLIKDVKIGPSPEWMRRRLFSMGLKSINNVVDITNFVLLEIGQPMHAFDLRDLKGNEINVRRAKKGEKIITLDEKEFKLDENNLVICDAEKPVALAGVMGGLNSGIKDDTKDVLFESARFARDNIRKTSRTLGQRSDSSARFEKGVDYLSQEIGLKRALNLVDKLGCGKIACDEYDLKGEQFKEKTIETTVDKINGVLGLDIAADTVKNILERLDFKVTLDGRNITVIVPLYREDVEGYPDLAEEVIREYGYDNITPTLLKTSAITAGGRNAEQKSAEDLKDLLIGYGYNETITYSFVSEKEFDLFGLDKSRLIRILNPISEDMAVMRTTLIPSLVRAAVYNINRQNHDGKLFELAKTYFTVSGGNAELPEEKEVLC